MRRVFPPADLSSTLDRVRQMLVAHSASAMALAVVLSSSPHLAAQSSTTSLSGFQQVSSERNPEASDGFTPPGPGGQRRIESRDPRTLDPIADLEATDENSKVQSGIMRPSHEHSEFLREVYYRNRLEFAFDVGWIPINIPFVFDVFVGDAYNMTPLKYTLVPVVASLRWQINDVGGPWIFRGNWDMTFSASATAIPRGPESHYFSYDMGLRRNFVPHRGKVAPYFDARVGLGRIDAKEPFGVAFAQGQNFTFTANMGSGARYNFNSRYSISAGLNWMHISNMYLSQPKYTNYGINVYGPLFGFDVRLGKSRRDASR